MGRKRYILLLCCLMSFGWMRAQKDQLSFFSGMGQADGVYEQAVLFSTEQDELDYWKDQRAFELALLRQNPGAYRIYLEAKHQVYAAHRHLCGPTCKHGDYYWLQASFYIQFGPESLRVYTSAGAAVPLPTANRQ